MNNHCPVAASIARNADEAECEERSVIVIVDGDKHEFTGDELTSAEQQAILFLGEVDEARGVF